MKDTDFPIFHNVFQGSSCLEQPEAIGVNNGLTFPTSPSPSKGLFQNRPNVMESFEPYTNDGFLSKHHNNNLNDFNSFSHEGLPPLAPTTENGTLLHGFPVTNKPFWGSQNLIIQAHEITPQNYTNPSSTSKLMDLEYSIKSTTPYQNGQNKREKNPTKTPKKVLVKGPWTRQEDSSLKQMVETHGIRNWTKIAKMFSGRVGKQCRERWHNHLRPDIKKDTWTEEEEKMLIRAHEAVGKKWVEIARRLPGRSENSIKNHWNATMRKLGTKKNNKKPNFKGSLLQNYIRSIRALPTNKNNNNNDILNNVVVENGESSSQAANDAASADHDCHADRQIQPENSDLIFVNNWVVNPWANLVYNDNDHDKKVINLGVENDNSLSSNSYGRFRSYMDEMTAMEEDRNVDIQMRSEIESLMKGPAEIKKEMDLMEMIFQGKI